MHTLRIWFCLIVIFSLISVSVSAADYWNEFRGPAANGHSPSEKLPVTWSEK